MVMSKDDLAVGPRHSPPQVRRGSDGSRMSRQPGPSGGKSVNKMLGLFESGHGSQPVSKPLPPPSPSKVRPVPPAKPTAVKKIPTQPSVQPLKKLHDGDGKTKVPLLPPNGRIAAGTPVKPSSLDSHKQGSGRAALVSTQKKQGGSIEGSETVKKMVQKLSSNSSSSSNRSQDETSSKYKLNGIGTEKLSTSCSVTKNTPKVSERKRAESADVPHSSKGQKVSSPVSTGTARIPPVHPQPYLGGNKKGSAESAPQKTITPPLTPKKTKSTATSTDYENIQPSHVKSHPQSPPKSLSQEDADYENLSFSNRDSDVYENIGIGFAGTGLDSMTGPLPPLPLKKNPVRQSYENVKVGKSMGRERRKEEVVEVMEDDDTLFGKEGPPGMTEMIYENFGPDKGNRAMTVEELVEHVETLGKKGLSTEYYRVRNEPITGLHKACR